jgi:hypothetical protein
MHDNISVENAWCMKRWAHFYPWCINHYGKPPLPSAFPWALGKERVCRVSSKHHPTKKNQSVSAMCFGFDTRQHFVLPCVIWPTTKLYFPCAFFYLQQSNKICFSSHSKRFHSFFTWLRLKKIYIKNCMSRKDLQLLIRKFFLKFNLNMCFLLIEYRRDTCEATHSYIYLLLPPSHIKDCNFKFSRTYKWRNGKTYLFAKSSKFCHANQIWPFN